ncbi:MAG: 2-iminoacetate synthase ThiH [Chitinivibrionales bacterium]
MSFYKIIETYKTFDFDGFFHGVTPRKIESILAREKLSDLDFLALLSDTANGFLEPMAEKARQITRKNFGGAILLFTPLYISNLCENVCAYCSFARQHAITRKHLTFEEIGEESRRIAESGIRHILVLTGEARRAANMEFLTKSVRIIGQAFSSVGIEIYPLTEEEYRALIEQGVDGLTLYQEIYDEAAYEKLHRGGPKEDYRFRLEAPERAARNGIRGITVGALMGLGDARREAFFTGLHARYLQKSFPGVEISMSFPRIRPLAGDFVPPFPVDDARFVQTVVAARIFLGNVGITLSTRESEEFRTRVIPLGVTKISAGVSTAVGAHSSEPSTAQFEIADKRTVGEIKTSLLALGFQPVMQDWNSRYVTAPASFSPAR